jgi:hypothetical protein
MNALQKQGFSSYDEYFLFQQRDRKKSTGKRATLKKTSSKGKK